jgi:hypothetical protein
VEVHEQVYSNFLNKKNVNIFKRPFFNFGNENPGPDLDQIGKYGMLYTIHVVKSSRSSINY